MKISLVVPVFNEEDAIPIFYKTVREFEGLQQHEVEIVFINDGSKDAQNQLLTRLLLQIRLLFLCHSQETSVKNPLCSLVLIMRPVRRLSRLT